MSSSSETANLDPAAEEILTYRVSDEAMEAAAGTQGASRSGHAAGYRLSIAHTFSNPSNDCC
jgi:hypothetical protein